MSRSNLRDSPVADALEWLTAAGGGNLLSHQALARQANVLWGLEENHVGHGIREMQTRRRLLGSKYPFAFDSGAIYAQNLSPIHPLYLALLAMSRPGPWQELAQIAWPEGQERTFEDVVQECFASFFGESTQVLNFGWPSTTDRPLEFDRAVRWLADKVGLPVGSFYRQPRRKDGGVDIVVWRVMPDRRPGVPLLLVQATVQADFVMKSRDIDRRLWAGWLSMEVDPIVCLAIPGAVTDRLQWEEVARNALLFDRLRLVDLATDSFAGSSVCMEVWQNALASVESVIDL